MPCKWNQLQNYLTLYDRHLVKVPGDGLCVMHAIKTCKLHDFDEMSDTNEMKDKILNYLLDSGDLYDEYHDMTREELVQEATKFFDSKDFNNDFGDLFVRIAADAMKVNMCIYQEHPTGLAQMIKTKCLWANQTIHVKLSRAMKDGSSEYSGANHYDSLVRFSPSEVEASKEPLKIPGPTVKEPLLIESISSDDDEDESTTVRKQYGRNLKTSALDLQIQKDMQNIKCADNQLFMGKLSDASINKFLRPRSKFPEHLFRDIQPEVVDCCPPEIDGNVFYKMPANYRNWLPKSKSRRYFAMVTSSKDYFSGKRKVGFCEGSWTCQNPKCPYLELNLRPNKVMWDNVMGQKVCYSCSVIMHRQECNARMLIMFSATDEMLYIYHIGHHCCKPKPNTKSAVEYCTELVKKYPTMTYKELKHQVLKEKIFEEDDVDGARRVAQMIDSRSYNAAKRLQGHGIWKGVEAQSLDAVGLVKEKTDKLDPFLIHRIHKSNNGKWDDDPDYVFNCSGVIVEICFQLDQKGAKNPLQGECLFFDGAHSRCTDYVALALWVYHIAMRKLIRLASMYVKSESSKSVKIFFTLFNEVLQKVSGNPEYKLNPRFILCDNSGANLNGMALVFGQEFVDSRVLGCRFHFLNCVENAKNKVGPAHRQEFAEGCHDLQRVETVAEYQLQLARLMEIADMYPDSRHFLLWWDARRYHVFKAFRELDCPGMNLAEVGNSGWKPKHGLSLVVAAKDDAASMTAQVGQYVRFRQGDYHNKGKGPTYLAKAQKAVKEQMCKARAFGCMFENATALAEQMIEEQHPNFFKSNKTCSHKPPEKDTLQGRKSRGAHPIPTLKTLMAKYNQSAKEQASLTGQEEVVIEDVDSNEGIAEETAAESVQQSPTESAKTYSLQLAEEMMNPPSDAEVEAVPTAQKRKGRKTASASQASPSVPENEISTSAPENEIITSAPENEISTSAPEKQSSTSAPATPAAAPGRKRKTCSPVSQPVPKTGRRKSAPASASTDKENGPAHGSAGPAGRSSLDRAKAILEGPQVPLGERNTNRKIQYDVRLGAGRTKRYVRPIMSTPAAPNPPIVTKTRKARVCQGCRKEFIRNVPTDDLIVQLQAVRPYPNADGSWWTDTINNAYCHLSAKCLKLHNSKINLNEMLMTQGEFDGLTDADMQELHNLGFLRTITNNL